MSYKANVDIVIGLNALRIASFRKQDYRYQKLLTLRSKKMYPTPKHQSSKSILSYCTPYNIYKHPKQQQTLLDRSRFSQIGIFEKQQFKQHHSSLYEPSIIDNDQQCYYSRIFDSKYQSQNHVVEECVYFRAYINVEQLETTTFLMRVELLLSLDGQQGFIEAGKYESTVHKISNVCTYLPIVFDQFSGFTINGSYQSAILEYRFESNEENGSFSNFSHYLEAATHGLNKQSLRQFYDYYRSGLESELFHIQQKHSDFLRILNIPSNYGFIKVGPNIGLLNLLGNETVKGLSRTKSREHLWGTQQLRDRLADQIVCDFTGLKGLIYTKWNEFIVFLSQRLDQISQYHRLNYDKHVKERLRSHVFSHQIEPQYNWTYSRYEDSGKQLLKQAEMDKQKQKQQQLWRQYFPIQNKDYFQEQGKTIKIFEEVYPVQYHRRSLTQQSTRKNSFDSYSSNVSVKQQSVFTPFKSQHELIQSRSLIQFHSNPSQRFISEKIMPQALKFNAQGYKNQHIVVFVHGYQASRQDFILFKSCLEIKYKCRVFISSSNEGKTEQSIQNLGKRLAVELNNYFKNIQFGPGTRISFVGHSMGGIIIRSALSYIRNIEQYLWAYLSFSSPHLGYLYEPSTLVQAGLWLLGALQKSDSIDQLCMRDSEDPRRTFLYRLTQNRSLQNFRQVAFLSSSQDEYVPYQSARIQKNNYLLSKLGESISASVIKEMVDNLIGETKCNQISRMNVVFNIEGSNFDSIVGRTAHIKYLSDQKFIKMFTCVFDKFFA